MARAEHTLTVTVAAGGAPLADALVRLGPYRAPTDASGTAKVRLAKGHYELVVWKTGYEMTRDADRSRGRRLGCGRDGAGAGGKPGRGLDGLDARCYRGADRNSTPEADDHGR